jgi:hypothetical protein
VNYAQRTGGEIHGARQALQAIGEKNRIRARMREVSAARHRDRYRCGGKDRRVVHPVANDGYDASCVLEATKVVKLVPWRRASDYFGDPDFQGDAPGNLEAIARK